MPIITSLEPQRLDPERVNLHLDHAFVAGLSLEVSLQAGLRVGDFLSPAALQELLQAEARQAAVGRALNFLSHRPRSEREVRQRLARHGVEPEISEAAVERLRRLGLIDDAAFARFWVEGRSQGNPRGRRALRAELSQKGVAREVVAETLGEIDEAPLAVEALRRVARRWQSLDPQDQRQRAFAYLQRRGFAYEEIAAAIRAWQQSTGDAAENDWPTEGLQGSVTQGLRGVTLSGAKGPSPQLPETEASPAQPDSPQRHVDRSRGAVAGNRLGRISSPW